MSGLFTLDIYRGEWLCEQCYVLFQVKRDLAGYFVETGELCQTMHIPQEHSSVELNMLHPDTFYRVELQAHNMIGYSVPGRATFKTARGKFCPPFVGNYYFLVCEL